MRPLKIVTLISLVEQGGAQMAILRLTQALRDKGHDVQAWGMYLNRNNTELKFDRIILPCKPGKIGYLKLLFKLTQQFRQHKPDAVISFLPLANTAGLLAAALAGVPRRIASQRNRRDFYRPIMRTLDGILGSTPIYHANVAVSQSTADSFAGCSQAYRVKMKVVCNGLVPPVVLHDRATLRSQLGIPADAFLLVSTGRLATEKNHTLLLNAIAPLEHVHLLIAGDGPLRETLEAHARQPGLAGRVHLPGPLPHAEIPSLLTAADGYALPSLHEGMSNALLEAMQMGLPILASDLPTQQEVLQQPGREDSGVLLPPHDTHAWTQAIQKLAQDATWRSHLAQLSKQRSGDFSLQAMADGFEQTLYATREARQSHGC